MGWDCACCRAQEAAEIPLITSYTVNPRISTPPPNKCSLQVIVPLISQNLTQVLAHLSIKCLLPSLRFVDELVIKQAER